MEEYYVRAPQAEQADGPFTIEQLSELAQSDLIRPETLYYQEGMEDFSPFQENPELWKQISNSGPAKPKALKLKSAQPAAEPPPVEPEKTETADSPTTEETAPLPLSDRQFFVRAPGSENADGPFSLNQLRELSDSGVITPTTLYYHEGMDDFAPLSENPDLWNEIKPAIKPALKLRSGNKPAVVAASDETPATKPPEESEKKISKKQKAEPKKEAPSPYDESGDIDRMLAAAEGKTDQTKHVQRLKKSRDRAVTILLPSVVFSLLMSVGFIVQPYWETIFGMFKSGEYSLDFLLENWIIFFAIVDLFLAIGIGLGQTGLFPILRLRCGIGVGFFFFLFYSRGEWAAVGASSALQLGLIGATLCTRFLTTFFFSILALAGAGAMIWLVWFKGIAF